MVLKQPSFCQEFFKQIIFEQKGNVLTKLIGENQHEMILF